MRSSLIKRPFSCAGCSSRRSPNHPTKQTGKLDSAPVTYGVLEEAPILYRPAKFGICFMLRDSLQGLLVRSEPVRRLQLPRAAFFKKMAALVFPGINNIDIDAPEELFTEMFLKVASGKMLKAEITLWEREYSHCC